MISNPKRFVLLHRRRTILKLMAEMVEWRDQSETERVREMYSECLKILGLSSKELKERIDLCPEVVDSSSDDYKKYIFEAEVYVGKYDRETPANQGVQPA